jgi:hypothetical protein
MGKSLGMMLCLSLMMTLVTNARAQGPSVYPVEVDKNLNCVLFEPVAEKIIYTRSDKRHEKVIWMERLPDGAFVPHQDIERILNPAAAQELALYMDALDLPRELRAGIMIFDALEPYRPERSGVIVRDREPGAINSDRSPYQKVANDAVVFLNIYVVEQNGCGRGEYRIGNILTGDGYDSSLALGGVEPANVDRSNYSMTLSVANCGAFATFFIAHGEIWKLSQSNERRAIENDGYISMRSTGIDPIKMDGKDIGSFIFAIYPGRTEPRVIIKGSRARFELPKYMRPWQVPRNIVVACGRAGHLNFRFVIGGEVKIIDDVPIEYN